MIYNSTFENYLFIYMPWLNKFKDECNFRNNNHSLLPENKTQENNNE